MYPFMYTRIHTDFTQGRAYTCTVELIEKVCLTFDHLNGEKRWLPPASTILNLRVNLTALACACVYMYVRVCVCVCAVEANCALN